MREALWEGFLWSAEKFPERPAIVAAGNTLSYRELRGLALRIARSIQSSIEHDDVPLTAVLAYRSPVAFAGVLGALLAGNGYVPLNPTFPLERTELMFERSECRTLVVDSGSLSQMEHLLNRSANPVVVVLPDLENPDEFRGRWPRHRLLGRKDLACAEEWQRPAVQPDALAYLLFTSGSTGTPKGVMVAQRNVISFVEYMVDRYQIGESDRMSQMFDMTFDLSAFDMFVAWERGACICCPSQKTLLKPGKFIQDMALTIWFSVPSTAMFMKQLGAVKPEQYPSLRVSLFCGEPLPVASAQAWQAAAPNSIVENLYGPTELTIACTLYRWDAATSPAESELDIVPIGYAYPGMSALVLDENLREVPAGSEGELAMAGPQMSLGYWKDAEKTAAAFVKLPDHKETHYRTGDRVRRPIGNAPLTHLGRTDFQVKILGHRVELGEIEAVVRKLSGLDGVVAVGWPVAPSGYGGVEVFLEGETRNQDALRSAAASRLPEYMVPRRLHFMARLPRNANDKFDRKAMTKLLQEGL